MARDRESIERGPRVPLDELAMFGRPGDDRGPARPEDVRPRRASELLATPLTLLPGTNGAATSSRASNGGPSGANEADGGGVHRAPAVGLPPTPWQPTVGIPAADALPSEKRLSPIGSGVDWGLVRAFRKQAADQLAAALNDRDGLDDASRRELGSSIVLALLSDHATEALTRGTQVFSPDEQQRLADAIFDSLFGLGRLQPLVDNPGIENVEIFGYDNVLLEFSDGHIEEGPAVADSDDELIDTLSFLASRSQANERPFSPSHPELHLRLDDGSRLAAWAWTTPRPAAVIRRHRLRQVTIEDLVARNSLTVNLATFLASAVRAKKSIVVSGVQGAGKTTLLRALCAELDPWERVGTIETEHELHLFELTDQHKRVIAWEARPGSGERGADGKPAGEISVADITYGSWRANLSRLIVGEVRGHEVLSMFEAMQGGAGSMSTTHANSGRAAVERLVTLSVKTGAPVEFAYRQVAEHIDLIVQISVEVHERNGVPFKDRFVTEVIALGSGERGMPAYTDVYRPGADGRATPGTLPHELRDLDRFGFDLASFNGVIETQADADGRGWGR